MKSARMVIIAVFAVLFCFCTTTVLADVMTVNDWKKNRPRKAKGTGMAKALKKWHSACDKDPSTFKKYEDFADAEEAVEDMEKALENAEKKLKKSSGKKTDATQELVEDSAKSVTKYKKDLEDEYGKRKKSVQNMVDEANGQLEKYENELKNLTNTVNLRRKLMDKLFKSAQKADQLGKSELEQLDEKLERMHDETKLSVEEAITLAESSKKDPIIVEYRRLGGVKLCAKHGVGGKDEEDAKQVFNENAARFKTFDRNYTELIADARKIMQDAGDALALTDTSLTAQQKCLGMIANFRLYLEKEKAGLIKKTLYSVDKYVKNHPTDNLYKWFKTEMEFVKGKKKKAAWVKKGKASVLHNLNSSIEIAEDKMALLNDHLKSLKARVKNNMSKIPNELKKDRDVAQELDKYVNEVSEIIRPVDEFIKKCEWTIREAKKIIPVVKDISVKKINKFKG